MNLETIAKTLEQAGADIKIDRIYWMVSTAYCASMPDDFKDDFLEETPERIDHILKAWGVHQVLTEDDLEEWDEDYICDLIHEKDLKGFLIKAATPVPHEFRPDGGYRTSGFGHYTTQWFYTEDLEQFAKDAVEWASAYVEKRRQEAA